MTRSSIFNETVLVIIKQVIPVNNKETVIVGIIIIKYTYFFKLKKQLL